MNTFQPDEILTQGVTQYRPTFMNKVFLSFAMLLGVASLGAYTGMQLILGHLVPLTSASLIWLPSILLIGLTLTIRFWAEKSPLNYFLASVLALVTGYITAPLLLVAVGVGGLLLPAKALFITGCIFAATALWGASTGKDMSSWGNILMISLVGIIVVSLVNIFLKSSVLSMTIDVCTILVFSIFTAYDIQDIKARYPDSMALTAAINLFLDFINLFQAILRLLIAMRRD